MTIVTTTNREEKKQKKKKFRHSSPEEFDDEALSLEIAASRFSESFLSPANLLISSDEEGGRCRQTVGLIGFSFGKIRRKR